MASLILEDLGTASELQRQTKSMLDRASVRPISIPRERSGEAITLVNRTLWHQALSAMESMKTLAAISLLVSDTLKHAERRRYPADLAWLAEFDEDDLQKFFGEYASAAMSAVTGLGSWDAVDTVIEQWRLRAIPPSRERDERENETLDGDSPRAISATNIPPSVPYVTETPHKGDDAPSSAPSAPSASLGVMEPQQQPLRKPRSHRTPDDIAASRILDATWVVMKQHHGTKLTIAARPWRARNKAAALEFHKAGYAPEDVVRLLRIAYEHPEAKLHHRNLTSLGKLAKWAPQLKRMAAEAKRNPEKKRVYRSPLQARQ